MGFTKGEQWVELRAKCTEAYMLKLKLGIPPGAGLEEIDRRYRPDASQNPKAFDEFLAYDRAWREVVKLEFFDLRLSREEIRLVESECRIDAERKYKLEEAKKECRTPDELAKRKEEIESWYGGMQAIAGLKWWDGG